MSRGNPAMWDPIRVGGVINPQTPMAQTFIETRGRKHHYDYRNPQRAVRVFSFANRLYDGVGLEFEDGSMHMSFKRLDRSAVRDWRHFQAIKNEVAGFEREAIEIFPPESELLDASNEYHLWVLPPGMTSPYGFAGRGVGPAHDTLDYAGYREGTMPPGGRQRPWERGLPTGLNLEPGLRSQAS